MWPVTYSLLEFVPVDRYVKRVPLALILSVGIGLGFLVMVYVSESIGTLVAGAWQTEGGFAFLVGTVLVVALVAVCLVITPRFLAGAREVRIGKQGVEFVYTKDRRQGHFWSDPTTHLILLDYHEFPAKLADKTAYSVQGPHVWQRRSLLSSEAFVAILGSAREHGAQIRESRGPEYLYGVSPKIYDIRGRAR